MWKEWKVSYGDKYADGLTYEEMLGMVAALTMPEPRPTLHWLKTEEEHVKARQQFHNSDEPEIKEEQK